MRCHPEHPDAREASRRAGSVRRSKLVCDVPSLLSEGSRPRRALISFAPLELTGRLRDSSSASPPQNDTEWRTAHLAQKRLDSKKGKDYTECTKAAGPPLPLLVPPAQKAAEKANMARMNAPRETASAEPKGKAKTLRQKDRIRTGLRKVRLRNRTRKHTKGATAADAAGISQV